MSDTITKRGIICVVIMVYLLTAVFSNGYHHPDEHFQLIEFAGLKLGWNTVADLTWEYGAKIRPALQPMIAYGVLETLHHIGIDNPYSQALALRLLSAALAICCIGCFIRIFARTVRSEHRTAYILLSFLLWFLPAVNVRFSSETWSGLLLLLGTAWIYEQRTLPLNKCMLVGIVFGLSFECRYQIALAMLGLVAWMWWVARWRWKQWTAFAVGGMLVLVVCTVIDRWFYGMWVFTPLLYFQVNILQDVASSFGILPVNYYLEQILYRPTFFIGLCIVFSFCSALLRDRKNPVLWCIIPFILVHSLIPHKELRFLFPMVNFVPLLLMEGYEFGSRLVNRHVSRAFLLFFHAVNIGGLFMLTAKPAGIGNVNMMQHIVGKYADKDMAVYATPLGNPCLESTFLPVHFYEDKRIRWNDYLEKEKELLTIPESVQSQSCLIVVMANEESKRNFLLRHGFMEEYRSIPSWVEYLNRFYQVYNPERMLILYGKK